MVSMGRAFTCNTSLQINLSRALSEGLVLAACASTYLLPFKTAYFFVQFRYFRTTALNCRIQ
jgi:hypothetical protein